MFSLFSFDDDDDMIMKWNGFCFYNENFHGQFRFGFQDQAVLVYGIKGLYHPLSLLLLLLQNCAFIPFVCTTKLLRLKYFSSFFVLGDSNWLVFFSLPFLFLLMWLGFFIHFYYGTFDVVLSITGAVPTSYFPPTSLVQTCTLAFFRSGLFNASATARAASRRLIRRTPILGEVISVSVTIAEAVDAAAELSSMFVLLSSSDGVDDNVEDNDDDDDDDDIFCFSNFNSKPSSTKLSSYCPI